MGDVPAARDLCGPKAAAWSLTNALRVELRPQGTLVVGVHAGYIDTEMAAAVQDDKLDPIAVARIVVEGVAADQEEILVDDFSRAVKSVRWQTTSRLLYPGIQERYDGSLV